MAARELTPRERKTVLALHHFIEENGYSPSMDELAARLGYAHRAAAHAPVRRLVDLGLIVDPAGKSRTLRLRPHVVVRGDEIFEIGEPDE
jgi:SOS-response transcriptional repressor LexA